MARWPVGRDTEELDPLWYNAQGFGSATNYGVHEGNDYNLRSGGDTDFGQPVYAIADGVVSSVHNHTTSPTFGRHIHIKHNSPFGTVWSHYAHLDEIKVLLGQEVKEGDLIGYLGKSGTTLAHLHFAIKKALSGIDNVANDLGELNLYWLDPTPFIKQWKVVDIITPAPTVPPMNDQTLIPFGGEIGTLELQAARSQIMDGRRNGQLLDEARRRIKELEDQIVTPTPPTDNPFTNQTARLLFSIARYEQEKGING